VGVTSDGGTGHTFFTPGIAGGPDTSDSGPGSDAVQFKFLGTWNGAPLTSGVFAAGDSAGPSLDGTVAHLNFLGGPNGADGPCGSCFFRTVATFPAASATPEPRSITLLGAGLATLAIFGLRYRRRPL
jgi:hypothetical protein